MKKIEMIWREILTAATERRVVRFQQKELATLFSVSTSTVSHALVKPRAIGAIQVSGRGFVLSDFEKLLMLWATERSVEKDIVYQTFIDMPVMQIEGLLPGSVIPTAYTGYRLRYGDTPADYDCVYCYGSPSQVWERFGSDTEHPPNLIVLAQDPFLRRYSPRPPAAQLFVDLWNLPQWYSRDYQQALLVRMRQSFGG